MIDPGALSELLCLAMVAGLLLAGAVTAWASPNVAKRVAGVFVAHVAAILALAVLGAPASALMVAVAIAFGSCALGVALLVRLQESYGATETPEIDAADARDEPVEPAA